VKKALSILLTFIIYLIGYGQNITEIPESVIKTSDFSKTSIASEFETVKIIGLGESSHWMGETYRTKVSLIKYLHQECGVNTIAFESGFYDMYRINEMLKNGMANQDSILKSLFGTWHTEEVIPLLSYIIESQKTDKPIQLVGIDNQFLRISDTYFISDYK